MNFKPLGNRALVKLVEREETTASGIVLPDTAKEKPQTAEVVAMGAYEESRSAPGTSWSFARTREPSARSTMKST